MCKSFFRRHVFCWAAAFFAVFLLLISGTVYADSPSVTVWPFPETLPEKYKSGDFSVQVENQNVPVYQSGLNAGDILSFRVDKFGNTAYDTTEWTPVIRYEN